jgi:DNA-binding HxlR family transcriptional regulator
MAALDLLGRRGALRILWELRSGDAFTFRALQDAAELSPATLNTRLRELRAAGIIGAEAGYKLTTLGALLLPALEPLNAWAARWSKAREKKPKRSPND